LFSARLEKCDLVCQQPVVIYHRAHDLL
jgi:hypothetical protein